MHIAFPYCITDTLAAFLAGHPVMRPQCLSNWLHHIPFASSRQLNRILLKKKFYPFSRENQGTNKSHIRWDGVRVIPNGTTQGREDPADLYSRLGARCRLWFYTYMPVVILFYPTIYTNRAVTTPPCNAFWQDHHGWDTSSTISFVVLFMPMIPVVRNKLRSLTLETPRLSRVFFFFMGTNGPEIIHNIARSCSLLRVSCTIIRKDLIS